MIKKKKCQNDLFKYKITSYLRRIFYETTPSVLVTLNTFFFEKIVKKNMIFFQFFILLNLIVAAAGQNVECEFKCQSDFEYCLSRCGGEAECVGICVRENDNCYTVCSVAGLIKKL